MQGESEKRESVATDCRTDTASDTRTYLLEIVLLDVREEDLGLFPVLDGTELDHSETYTVLILDHLHLGLEGEEILFEEDVPEDTSDRGGGHVTPMHRHEVVEVPRGDAEELVPHLVEGGDVLGPRRIHDGVGEDVPIDRGRDTAAAST